MRKKVLFASLACVLTFRPSITHAQPLRIAQPIDERQLIPLSGTKHAKAQARYDQGPEDPSRNLPYITLMLKPSAAQQSSLEKLLQDQQDRSSVRYHRWLTPEQFGDQFGLAPSDYAAVSDWLESQGLHLEQKARARNFVAFSGDVAHVQQAFHTSIHRYQIEGESYYANATELAVPAALHDLYGGVRGLDDFDHPRHKPAPQYDTSSGSNQLAPEDWATIYNVNPLYAMGIDGTGQRIGILGAYDMNQSFIDSFRKLVGLPASTVEQHLIGPDPGITASANEASLDLEWAGAIAPKATLVYIYATNFNTAAQAAIDQNLATILSESFASCEPSSAVGNRIMAQQANAQGITWVASSGDSGGAGCDAHGFFGTTGNTTVSDGPAVGIPASFPEVTAMGGTMFNEAGGQYWRASNDSVDGSAISYIPEVVWNETGAGGLLASGGGPSIFFTKPAWQVAPGVPDDNARDVPDISFSAAGNHDPYLVINSNGQRATGGTSASAPSFAGVLALLNQYVVKSGLQSQAGLGNVNPELYRLARVTTNVFHDITQGNNMVPCAAGSPGCTNGTLGFNAGPGYDLATGLGSLDVANFVTQWGSAAAPTTTSGTANPASITLGDSVQLTATVSPVSPVPSVPGGSVTFSIGRTILGIAPVMASGGVARATLTVTGPRIPAGSTSVSATYSGDANYGGSTGTVLVNVAASGTGSFVTVNITPNPAHEGQFVRVTLTEMNGVGTTVTGWTINGVDDFSLFAGDFGGTTLAPYGSLSTSISTAAPAVLPSNRVYVFTGMDADGRQWTARTTLVLQGALGTPAIALTSAPSALQQNTAADASCQWSQQLIVQENLGFAVQLTRLKAGSADWTGQIQQLFGTNRLAPLGMLQAHICWPGPTAPSATTFELDGADQSGLPVSANVTSTYAGSAASPVSLSVASSVVTLGIPSGVTGFAGGTLGVNLTGSGSWSATVIPANRSTAWLTATTQTAMPAAGLVLRSVNVQASAVALSPGVYSATLLIQAADAVPQFLEVPVVFIVGDAGATIGGVSNGASFQQFFAPGMILSAFGTNLAQSTQVASALPLPLSLGGVSATVNGVPAPLYFVSSGQVNLQVPYETGAGTAVLGINNGGTVSAFTFPIAAAGPGVFTNSGQNNALVPISTAKHGDTIPLFITGEGLVSNSLATGASAFSGTPLDLLPAPLLPVTVTVGGVPAHVTFAGVPSGLAGATQVNFVIPDGAPAGLQPVVVTVGGVSSQAANVTIAP
ncbi:MAG TPA: protease pro-enzyme activation domain-containing protein [Bryobacteraceae bacterium]|nr:protease pro-enzyme activation domain-containing protein [Bryobacteraceae bacterium]